MLVIRYSKRTIDSYSYWIKYFIIFNKKQHPNDLGIGEIRNFITHLAVNRDVSATQAIALNALAFFMSNRSLFWIMNKKHDFI